MKAATTAYPTWCYNMLFLAGHFFPLYALSVFVKTPYPGEKTLFRDNPFNSKMLKKQDECFFSACTNTPPEKTVYFGESI